MRKIAIGLAVLAVAATAGCQEHIHDPWVTGDDYHREDRLRSQELSGDLDNRMSSQRDR